MSDKTVFAIIVLLFSIFHEVTLEEIPVIFWNVKGNSLLIKPIPKIQQNDLLYHNNLNFAIQDGAHILMFVVNNLSLEDFSVEKGKANNTLYHLKSFLDTWPHMFISSVNDPVHYMQKAHCTVGDIEINTSFNISILEQISTALSNTCILVVHISEKKGTVKNLFLLPFENLSFNVIGVFTAEKSSWVSSKDHYTFRKLLQKSNATIPEKDIINFKDCILFYSSSIHILIKNLINGTLNIASPSTSGSTCTEKRATLFLRFKPAKHDIEDITLKFLFKNRGASWQTYTLLNITIKKFTYKSSITSSNITIGAPYGKAYYCGDGWMKAAKQKYKVKIFFSKLKIQPFGVKNKKFSNSRECVPAYNTFTLEILECVAVFLLYLAIIWWGMLYLISIKAMDHFDDEKDKTSSVAVIIPK